MIEELILNGLYFLKDKEALEEIINFQKSQYRYIDSKLSKENFACKKGCYYCCIGWKVNATLPEILLIIQGLNNLSEKKRVDVYKRLKEFEKEKDITLKPCPFLEEKLCIIYENRPFICRTYVSYDENLCKNKISFTFPDIVEKLVEYTKKQMNSIDEFFQPFFRAKIDITQISFNKDGKAFYLNLADTVHIYPFEDQIILETGKLGKEYFNRIMVKQL